MKSLQYALCGIFLSAAAVAQTTTPAPTQSAPPPSATSPAAASKPMQLSTLGQPDVKGPEHPLTLEQAKVLYEAMGYKKTVDENVQTMISTQKARAPFIPVDFWDDLNASFQKIDYTTAFLNVYKKYLSTDDAAKVIEFSKTPAGKNFLETLPATSREIAAAVQQEQRAAGQEVQAKHKDELDAAIKKYRDEQQAKPSPSLGPTAPGSTAPTPGATAPAKPTPAPATPPASTTPNN